MRLGVTTHSLASTSASVGHGAAFPAVRPFLTAGVHRHAGTNRGRLSIFAPKADFEHAQDHPPAPGNEGCCDGERRPRTAWNKGKSVPEQTRQKISEGLKSKWQDPEFRATVTAKQKGKPAWNKGRTVSEETRAKMRAAKLNHPVSRATRKKQSEAHRGRPLPAEAAALVSAALTGRPKSEEHKQKIAAAQRRRHAATRVLHAVEAVYQSSSSDGTRGAAAGMRRASGVGVSPPRSEPRQAGKSQFLSAFKAELREYRDLQAELSPWTEAWVERHGCKPTMLDVQRTGIDWLVTRYKQYIVLRERLFSETSLLRGKLGSGVADAGAALSSSGQAKLDAACNGGPINANGPTSAARSALASRVSVALEYKKNRQAAAAAVEQHPGAPRDLQPAASSGRSPPRVQAAMQAAIDYRKAKAQATKAAAGAAAAVARVGRSTPAKGVAGPASPAAAHHAQCVQDGATATSDAVLRAQNVAQRALHEVNLAEAEVRRALRLGASESYEEDVDSAAGPAAPLLGAGA